MNALLIWLCLLPVLLTLLTLTESIRDLRAVRRQHGNQRLVEACIHAIAIESIRLVKVTALTFAIFITYWWGVSEWRALTRNWIIFGVAATMGFTSLAELMFRHRFMRNLRREMGKR